MAESELFSFNTGGKKPSLRQFAGDKPPSRAAPLERAVSSDSEGSSSGSYYSEDEEGTGRRRRKRRSRHRRAHHVTIGDKDSIASRLMHNKPTTVVLDDDSDDDDVTITSPNKKCKVDRSGSSSPSLSPSPCPSPPPVVESSGSLADKKSRKTLDKANNVLNMLRWSRPSDASFSDSYSDASYLIETPPTSTSDRRTMTLRVRCKGKVHKFDVCKGDPLSGVCSQLANQVGADGGDKLLLSHKNSTIRQTESPASLGLTTADIIDAVVMTDSVVDTTPGVCDGGSGGPSINIKVQSSNKSIVYSLSKTDPLQKAMTAFASALGISITKLKFTFDGDPIKPTQTATELDMENDDCIDVRVIS